MQARAWLNALRDAPRKKPLPVLSFPCVSLLNITVKDLIADSGLQAEGMRRVAERVDAAAAVSFMDLSVEAEAFGCPIRISDDEVPTVTGAVITSEEEARALPVPEVGTGRTGRCIEAIKKAAGAHHRPARVRRGHRPLLPGRPPDGRHRGPGQLLYGARYGAPRHAQGHRFPHRLYPCL